jgi:hypothetical protein
VKGSATHAGRANDARRSLRGALASLLVFLGLAACASAPDDVMPAAPTATGLPLRADAASVIAGGEECVYGVAWSGILPVGRVIYRTHRETTRDGDVIRYEGITEILAYLSAFLKAGGNAEVIVDPATYAPRVSYWITAETDDPLERAAWFDRERGEVRTGKWSRAEGVSSRIFAVDAAFDPLSAIYLARILDFREDEIRLPVIEGSDRHLMTMRVENRADELVHDGRRVTCLLLAVRTWWLDDAGEMRSPEPQNSINVWIAEEPHRPILRMSGRTGFGTVALKLARWTPGGSDGT